MEKNPVVTYVIACYNHAEYIAEAIESIVKQSYSEIELIVIDDGSSDNSGVEIEKLIQKCKKRFVRFEYRANKNQGLCRSLNEAIAWSEGSYFACLASDDFIYPEKVAEQVNYLEKNTNCAAVFGNVNIVNEKGQVIHKYRPKKASYGFYDVLMHFHYLPAATQLMRLSVLKQVRGYPVDIKIEDWYMWLKMSELGLQLHRLPKVVAGYRRHASNTSGQIEIMHNGRLDVLSRFNLGRLGNSAKAWAFMCSAQESRYLVGWQSWKFYLRALKLKPTAIFHYKTYRVLGSILKASWS